MGNKLCNENDVSTVPVIAPVVVESNVTSSVTGETDMTSGGNLSCNVASCEQTTNETLSDRDNNLTIADTDGKKNAEPSQNGTAGDLSDLRRMMQGVGDFIKMNDDFKQLQQKMDAAFQQQQQKMATGFQQQQQKMDTAFQQQQQKMDTAFQ